MKELRVTDLDEGELLLINGDKVEVVNAVAGDKHARTYMEYECIDGCTACDDAIGGKVQHRIHSNILRDWSKSGFVKRPNGVEL